MKRITKNIPHIHTVSFYNFMLKIIAVAAYIVILSVIFGIMAGDNNENESFTITTPEEIAVSEHITYLIADNSKTQEKSTTENVSNLADKVSEKDKEIIIDKLKDIRLSENNSD